MAKKYCLQKEAGAKKLFATTTTPKKIVCVDEMSIPPLQKNNGPSLKADFHSVGKMSRDRHFAITFF